MHRPYYWTKSCHRLGGAQIVGKDSNKQTRWIRKPNGSGRANVFNRDEGVYYLSHVYYQLVQQRIVQSKDEKKNMHPARMKRLFSARKQNWKRKFWTWKREFSPMSLAIYFITGIEAGIWLTRLIVANFLSYMMLFFSLIWIMSSTFNLG